MASPTPLQVQITGDLDFYTTPGWRKQLTVLLATPPSRLILDLTPVEFLDSTGISLTIWVHKQMAAGGGALAIVLPLQPYRHYRQLGLDKIMTLCANPDEAQTKLAAAA